MITVICNLSKHNLIIGIHLYKPLQTPFSLIQNIWYAIGASLAASIVFILKNRFIFLFHISKKEMVCSCSGSCLILKIICSIVPSAPYINLFTTSRWMIDNISVILVTQSISIWIITASLLPHIGKKVV